MSSFLAQFKSISAVEYKRCTELVVDSKYPYVSLRNVDTKFGNSVLATIRDCADNTKQYRVYLPKRYANVFSDEDLRNINPDFHLVYKGLQDRTIMLDIIPCEQVTDVPVIIADVNDEKTLSQMASKARVVINCVGPFNFYGEAVVKACIEQRTHLIDIAGEIKYMKTIQLEYSVTAAEKGVYIINACGLMSMLTDLGILHFLDNFNGEVNSLELYSIPCMTTDFQGPFAHYGSWQSYVCDTSPPRELKLQHEQHFTSVPNSTSKLKHKAFLHKRDIVNAWCLPLISSDNAVAVSQQYLYKHKNERLVQIQSYIGFKQLWVTIVFALFSILFVIMTKTSFTRKLLLKYPKTFSFGTVSNEVPEENLTLFIDTIIYGEGWTKQEIVSERNSLPPNKAMITKVSSKHTAYFVTAITSILSGITILKEDHKMPGKGGVFTPVSAFVNTSLQQELESCGIKFEIVSKKL